MTLIPNWLTPNFLTLFRICSIPVIYALVMLYPNQHVVLIIAFLVYLIACLTDYWDGVLARKIGQITNMGKLLDPIADKLLIVALLILLVALDRAPHLPVVLITLRELAISGVRSMAASRGVIIPAGQEGKIKTISQMLATGFLILHEETFWIPSHEVGVVLLWTASLLSIWSAVPYLQGCQKILSEQE